MIERTIVKRLAFAVLWAFCGIDSRIQRSIGRNAKTAGRLIHRSAGADWVVFFTKINALFASFLFVVFQKLNRTGQSVHRLAALVGDRLNLGCGGTGAFFRWNWFIVAD